MDGLYRGLEGLDLGLDELYLGPDELDGGPESSDRGPDELYRGPEELHRGPEASDLGLEKPLALEGISISLGLGGYTHLYTGDSLCPRFLERGIETLSAYKRPG